MPTEITAIVQNAEPGGELACRALDHEFEDAGVRGVISYYATQSLPHATTAGSWLTLIEAASTADLRRGRITTFELPSLRIAGDASARIPGTTATAAGAATPAWSVLSREDGCVNLDVLARGDRLPRVPISPDDYADMMRARGHQVTVGPAPGLPPDLAGKVVMVTVRTDRAPIFVRSDACPPRGR